jgi:hypothetical protein
MLEMLKHSDLGIIMFYLFFIIIIPTLLLIYTNYLKYYMPLMITLANMLTHSLSPVLFKNLYNLKSHDTLTIISTHFIILYSIIGILWLSIDYSQTGVKLQTAIIYGIILYIITYILSNEPMLFIIDKITESMTPEMSKWSKLIIGTIYVVLILLLIIILSRLTNMADKEFRGIMVGNTYRNNNVRKNVSLTSVNNLFKK